MIKVSIEMLPYGSWGERYTIGEIFITNDGSGTEKIGNYHVEIFEKDKKSRSFQIKNFKRSKKIWYLLKSIMKEVE